MSLRGSFISLLTVCAFVGAAAAEELDKDYLKRWTPGGDTNVADLPYKHRYAPYERETDDDWVDGRWQRAEKGPFLTHSIQLPGRAVGPKVCAVQAGAGKYVLFDLSAGSFVAGATGGDLQISPARFGLLNRPQLQGYESFYVPASQVWYSGDDRTPVAGSECDFQGLYLHGNRVLFVTQVAGVEVLESVVTNTNAGRITRELEIAPHLQELWLTIAKTDQTTTLGKTGRLAEFKSATGGPRSIHLDAASPGVALQVQSNHVLLYFAPTAERASVAVTYTNGPRSDASVSQSPAATPPDLQALQQPGPVRWGAPLVTRGALAAACDSAFVVDRIGVPHENRFKAIFFLSGLAFFSNGDAALSTAHGDVWIVRGLDEKLKHVTWQRFATGLYQPLGLEIVDDQVLVLGRDQITRLHDNNGDGEADFYESFNHDLIDPGMPHAFAMRLDRAVDGGFVFLKSGDPPHGSSLLHVSKDGGELSVVARGFRHPFGLGVGPRGEITVADNEGNWVPSSKIDLIEPGSFHGFLGSAETQGDSPPPARPLCFVPKVADNSSGGQVWHTSPQWGSYHRNEMFHFSWGRCTLHAVLRQQVGDVWQAATVEVPGVKFRSGPAEAAFHPRDGQLYVVGLDGWQTAAVADGSFERVRSTGKPAHLPSGYAAHADGIAITFDEPLDRSRAENAAHCHVEQWNYKWSSIYGSFHYSVADPDRVGHDKVKVEHAMLSADGKQLFLKMLGLRPVDQLHVAYDLRGADGTPIKGNLYATINALGPPLASTALAQPIQPSPTTQVPPNSLLARENLVAWCIVPFDARKRGPEERAAMLEKLGIRKIAYDWRAEHIPTFDAELDAYARHDITLHAFWMPVDTADPLTAEAHWPLVLDLVKRHHVKPELWVMLNNSLVDSLPESERAQRAAEILAPVARAAAERGCRIGFYNHGGWWGEPDNQLAVLNILHSLGIENVGLAYNFHHGHSHVAKFAELARRMAPHLLTVNINGMRDSGPQILAVGEGNREAAMLADLVAAGYRGPIGILHHRDGVDAEQGLQENLSGIETLRVGPEDIGQ